MTKKNDARVLVVSSTPAAPLLHHGIRSLILNPSVVATAMIGCCYNLPTERLGPPTYKLPVLRHIHSTPQHRRNSKATRTASHMSPLRALSVQLAVSGIKFNITARMMACQALPLPGRGKKPRHSSRRHYYRALLQKFFADHGVAPKPESSPRSMYFNS